MELKTKIATNGKKYMPFHNVAWISSSGEYSAGDTQVYVFERKLLTAKQWRVVDELYESDRIQYIGAILRGDTEDVEAFEMEVGA